MVRRGIVDGKPPTKYAPHATHDEWRAGRRNVPPPMTSQALRSALVVRHQQYQQDCGNATPSAITNGAQSRGPVSRRSNVHSTRTNRRVGALLRPPAKFPRCTLPPRAAHTMVHSSGTAGTRANNASPEGVSANCDLLEGAVSGAPWRAHYIPLLQSPNPW